MVGLAEQQACWIVPEPLRPGDCIRVVAPCSPFEVPLVWRGLGWLRERYEVRFDRRIFARTGYLAGKDSARLDELRAALQEPGVQAIVAARGGYGSTRFAHQIDWQGLRRLPRWLVGFSDVTALHVEATRVRVASLHGPNLTALGRSDARTRSAFAAALEQPHAERVWSGLETLCSGEARGPMVGGNLTLLQACAASGRLDLPDGCVLLLEDIGERPYRLDRMLTALRVGGHLGSVAGVVAGQFEACTAGADRVAVSDVLAECLRPLGIPVALGAPVGHGLLNEPVILGAPALLDASTPRASVALGLPRRV